MIALDAADHYNNNYLDELATTVTISAKSMENVKQNFSNLLKSTYDKMIEMDQDYVFSLAQKFYKEIELIPDYKDMYAMGVDLDPITQKLIVTEDAAAIMDICKEQQQKYQEYLDIQQALIKLYM